MATHNSGSAPKDAHRRGYSSALRARQAAETRERVIAAAGRLFSTQGYAATTMAQVAAAAEVSAETVQSHGPKAALLQAAVEVASLGVEGRQNMLESEYGAGYLAAPTSRAFAEYSAHVSRGLNERVGGLWRALAAAAATDDGLAERWEQMTASVDGSLNAAIDIADERGWLRRDVPRDELLASAMALIDSGVHDELRRRGFSAERYEAWLARSLHEALIARPWPGDER